MNDSSLVQDLKKQIHAYIQEHPSIQTYAEFDVKENGGIVLRGTPFYDGCPNINLASWHEYWKREIEVDGMESSFKHRCFVKANDKTYFEVDIPVDIKTEKTTVVLKKLIETTADYSKFSHILYGNPCTGVDAKPSEMDISFISALRGVLLHGFSGSAHKIGH
jgi:hypothetical protein